MGFNWDASVSTGYAQQVMPSNCYSRFATRCLKLANPVVRTKKQKTRTKFPGEDLPDPPADHRFEEFPFSDTEEEVEAMRPKHREVYEKIKKGMKGYHDSEELIICNYFTEACVNQAFQAAVEHLFPGQGSDFAIRVQEFGGAHGEVGMCAEAELAYLLYVPTCTHTGAAMVAPRGEIDIPWGYKMTPIRTLDAETSKQVDAAFAVIVDRLGLTAVDAPGLKLITTSSGG